MRVRLIVAFCLIAALATTEAAVYVSRRSHAPQVTAAGFVAPTNGLISYWSFDGNANDNFDGNNGTVDGAVLTNGNRDVALTAYLFDGINDRILCGTNFTLTYFTLAAWVKFTGLTLETQDWIMGESGTAQIGKIGSSNNKLYVYNGVTYPLSLTQCTTNQWYHVVGTADGTNLKIYVNGIYENSIAGGTASATANQFSFGRTSSGSQELDGRVDNGRVYSRALASNEVWNLYNAEL